MPAILLVDENGRGLRERYAGEKIAGTFFMFPAVTSMFSTKSKSWIEVSQFIWLANEFNISECKWNVIVSQIGTSATGTVELFNYTDNVSIASQSISEGSNFLSLSSIVSLTFTSNKMLGIRIRKDTGSGTVEINSSMLTVREI